MGVPEAHWGGRGAAQLLHACWVSVRGLGREQLLGGGRQRRRWHSLIQQVLCAYLGCARPWAEQGIWWQAAARDRWELVPNLVSGWPAGEESRLSSGAGLQAACVDPGCGPGPELDTLSCYLSPSSQHP